MADRLHVTVISPSKAIFEGEADSVVVPAWDGELGILRGHAPMVALLGEGDLRIRSGGSEQRFHVAGGFMQVVEDRLTIMSERASGA